MKKTYLHCSLMSILVVCVSCLFLSCTEGPEQPAEAVANGEAPPGPTAAITLEADPTSIAANGASSSTIKATLKDVSGEAVATGTVISFSTTLGTFANGSTSYARATAGDTGTTIVSLIAGTASGTAGVGATSNGVTQTVSVEFTAQALSTIGLISLGAGSTSLIADGLSTTTITATVLDSSQNPVADGTTVGFINNTNYGTLSATTAQTSGGAASVILTSPTKAGYAAVIRATTGNLTDTVTVSFIPGPPFRIYANVNPQTISAVPLICPNDSARIAATVVDISDNPVADGTEVVFSIDKGWIWDTYPECPEPGEAIPVVDSKTVSTANGSARIAIYADNRVETGTVDICVGGLCYEDATGNRGIEVSYGATTGESSGLPNTVELTLSVTSIQVKGTGGTETATITAEVRDESGNPIDDSYTASDGSTTAGSAIFTSATAKFSTKGFSANDTLSINSGTDNGVYTISSVDSDTQVTLNQAMTTTASGLNFTATVKDNITFEILLGPGGGETIDGQTSSSTKSTVDGEVNAILTSGTYPGSVTVRVTCTQGGKTATATSPVIGIESGPPFNITIYQDAGLEDNGDGTVSQIISALVQDQYGNPVPDDSAIYFGLVDNPNNGYKSNGADGVTNGTTTFTSASTNFSGDGVGQNNTLIILEGQDEGGYIISTVGTTTVTLVTTLSGTETNLDFVAGDAERGQICGGATTGNREPDGTCTPSSGTAVKGVAHTRLTWGAPAIWKPYNLFAATQGRGLGRSLSDSYPALTRVGFPIAIDVSVVPSKVTGGTTVSVYAHLHDGAENPHDIGGQVMTFTTSDTANSGFGAVGTVSETATGGDDGWASVTNLETLVAAPANTSVTITVSAGGYTGSATLTIN